MGTRRQWHTRRRPTVGGLPLAVLALLYLALTGCAAATRPAAETPTAPPALAAGALRYVAIGASDAYGVGTQDPRHQSWPSVLASSLGRPVHLINLGIPGVRTAQARESELPVALDAKPNVVTVWLGVNDLADGVSLASYTADLRALLGALQRGTSARVYVGNLPDLSLLPYFAGRDAAALRGQVAAWNAAIATVAAEQGATVVDLATGWQELASHPEYLAPDGLHPSPEGARRLAEIFLATMLPDLLRARGG